MMTEHQLLSSQEALNFQIDEFSLAYQHLFNFMKK